MLNFLVFIDIYCIIFIMSFEQYSPQPEIATEPESSPSHGEIVEGIISEIRYGVGDLSEEGRHIIEQLEAGVLDMELLEPEIRARLGHYIENPKQDL